MAEVARITRLQSLLRKLEKLERDVNRQHTGAVVVGFAASYALHVHENTGVPHKVGQSKYLEQPARELSNSGELARIVREAAAKGVVLVKALKLAGLRIQRESQNLVPVDTGNLRGSAFTAEE